MPGFADAFVRCADSWTSRRSQTPGLEEARQAWTPGVGDPLEYGNWRAELEAQGRPTPTTRQPGVQEGPSTNKTTQTQSLPGI